MSARIFFIACRVSSVITLAAGHVAVLGGVGDRVRIPWMPCLVHQVDDQLELVQALEVREARVVAGLDQGLEAGLDELGGAAAEDGLLAEEVGLGLVLEGGLDDPGAPAADAACVGQDLVAGSARWRPGGRPSGRGTPWALDELARGRDGPVLWGDHADVHARGGARSGRSESAKPWANIMQVAVRVPVRDLVPPDLCLLLVRQEDHHDVARLAASVTSRHLRGLRPRPRPAVGVGRRPTDHIDARVLQVEGVGVAHWEP
jgi:hypothetical protein